MPEIEKELSDWIDDMLLHEDRLIIKAIAIDKGWLPRELSDDTLEETRQMCVGIVLDKN